MTIPQHWLSDPITLAEAEEDIGPWMPSDMWLSQWRAFLGRFTPGDELWTYFGGASELCEHDSGTDLHEEFRAGLVRVHGGEIVESIEYPWLT